MKKLFCFTAVLLTALLFAGCKGEEKPDSNNNSSAAQTVSGTVSASSEITFPPKAYSNTDSVSFDGKHFAVGLWETKFEGTVSGVYRFNEDGTDCEYYVLQEEASIPFDYLVNDDGGYIFHLGTPDFDTGATVVFADSTHATLTWETTESEELAYLGDITVDEYLKNK